MDGFEERIHENLIKMRKISLFRYALIFITSLLVSFLALFILGMWIYAAFIPACLIVGVLYLLGRRYLTPIRDMERGNPVLEERLRTAYDNQERDNIITRGLVREVSYDLTDVSSDAFINMKRVNTYVAVSIIVVFILLFLLFAGFGGLGLGGLFGGGGGGGSGGVQGEGSGTGGGGGGLSDVGEMESSQETSIGQGPPENIYGDQSIAQIDGQDMELEMHPEYGEYGDFDMEGGEGGAEEIRKGFVQATAAESYTENIPVELEGVVRKYFERLAEE